MWLCSSFCLNHGYALKIMFLSLNSFWHKTDYNHTVIFSLLSSSSFEYRFFFWQFYFEVPFLFWCLLIHYFFDNQFVHINKGIITLIKSVLHTVSDWEWRKYLRNRPINFVYCGSFDSTTEYGMQFEVLSSNSAKCWEILHSKQQRSRPHWLVRLISTVCCSSVYKGWV